MLQLSVVTFCNLLQPMFASGIHSEGPIKEQAAQVPIAYNRRSTRSTRAADILKTQAAEAKKAKEPDAAVKKEEKQLEAARMKAEADKKKEETKKQKQQKGKAAGKNMRAKLQLTKDDQALCDEHEKWLMQLREHANEEISKLKRSVPCEVGPSAAAGDLSFLEDLIDDINSQPLAVQLS
jgi:hypothetical protein